MSLSFINKKFEALAEREKEVNNYYDPVNRHDKQHRHIEDLREDYQEDLKNYVIGFSKNQLKKDIQQKQMMEEEEQTRQDKKRSTMDRGLREQLRPTTAPMRRPDTMNYQSERSKYWRNTKKFDTANENQIRNQSALQRLLINQNRNQKDIEQEDILNSQVVEKRINSGKLASLQQQKQYQSVMPSYNRKKSPTEKDKYNLFVGFQEQKNLLIKPDSKMPKSIISQFHNQQIKSQSNSDYIGKYQRFTNNYVSNQSAQPIKIHYQQSILLEIIDKNQLEYLKLIESLILQPKHKYISDPYQNQDIFNFDFTQFPLSQIMPLHSIIIELKTMNIIQLPDIVIDQNNQILFSYQDQHIPADFKSILKQLYQKSEQLDHNYPSSNLYYILIYQQCDQSIDLIFERFYYDSSLSLPISQKLENLITLFYIRILMIQDDSVQDFETVLNNSLFVMSKKQHFPNQLYTFISQMQLRRISLQADQIFVLDLYDILTNAILNEPKFLPESNSYTSFDVQVGKMVSTQPTRPQTAFSKKPASVQMVEKMSGKIRPQSSTIAMDEPKQRFREQKLGAEEVQTEVQIAHSQRSQGSQMFQPINNQFAMSMNFGDENLGEVIKLLASKSKEEYIFKTKSQGLRPQTALKRSQKTLNKEESKKRVGSAVAWSDQQNLREKKKVKGMSNQIVIKGSICNMEEY